MVIKWTSTYDIDGKMLLAVIAINQELLSGRLLTWETHQMSYFL
jgi:hypothetical protein